MYFSKGDLMKYNTAQTSSLLIFALFFGFKPTENVSAIIQGK